jgi:type III pantothenate kinase
VSARPGARSERLLAVDVGNTQIVLGLFAGERLQASWRVATRADRTADELKQMLAGLLGEAGTTLAAIPAVAVSSVVPAVTRNLSSLGSGRELLVVGVRTPLAFDVAVPLPEQVGADRLVNAEAAVTRHGVPVVIVDAGTATTFCAVDARRRYLGGAIAPGIQVGTDALIARASRLASVDLAPPGRAIGDTTESALQSGIVLGHAVLIDGMVRRIKAELVARRRGGAGRPPRVVGTGGWMELLGACCREVDVVDRELTLHGLYYVWRRAHGRPVAACGPDARARPSGACGPDTRARPSGACGPDRRVARSGSAQGSERRSMCRWKGHTS